MERISNRAVNDLLTNSLRTNTLKGTWVEMEEIPSALSAGKDVVLIAPTRSSLQERVEDLTVCMRRARVPYRHVLWVKGQRAAALAFKVICEDNGKACYCVSEENLNILKQVKADKHYRIF